MVKRIESRSSCTVVMTCPSRSSPATSLASPAATLTTVADAAAFAERSGRTISRSCLHERVLEIWASRSEKLMLRAAVRFTTSSKLSVSAMVASDMKPSSFLRSIGSEYKYPVPYSRALSSGCVDGGRRSASIGTSGNVSWMSW